MREGLTALHRYSLRFDSKHVLTAANQLLDHFKDEYQITEVPSLPTYLLTQTQTHKHKLILWQPHPRITRALVQVVSRHGLKDIKNTLKQLVDSNELGYQLKFADKILEMLERMKSWRSLGYDR